MQTLFYVIKMCSIMVIERRWSSCWRSSVLFMDNELANIYHLQLQLVCILCFFKGLGNAYFTGGEILDAKSPGWSFANLTLFDLILQLVPILLKIKSLEYQQICGKFRHQKLSSSESIYLSTAVTLVNESIQKLFPRSITFVNVMRLDVLHYQFQLATTSPPPDYEYHPQH